MKAGLRPWGAQHAFLFFPLKEGQACAAALVLLFSGAAGGLFSPGVGPLFSHLPRLPPLGGGNPGHFGLAAFLALSGSNRSLGGSHMAIFQVKNLTFTYPNGASPALKDIGLSLNGGEFMALCGRSGCGKSTLLRHLKSPLTPYGSRSGEILFEGEPIEKADRRRQASAVGFVQQNPDSQLVCDKVWHELAFGLSRWAVKTGNPPAGGRDGDFFGIEGWFHKDVAAHSGGISSF
jgi:hypothetical protein